MNPPAPSQARLVIRDLASGEKPTVFTCADDEAARSIVIALA
jgi:hypothetical protein